MRKDHEIFRKLFKIISDEFLIERKDDPFLKTTLEISNILTNLLVMTLMFLIAPEDRKEFLNDYLPQYCEAFENIWNHQMKAIAESEKENA